jgi:hypothetical protein
MAVGPGLRTAFTEFPVNSERAKRTTGLPSTKAGGSLVRVRRGPVPERSAHWAVGGQSPSQDMALPAAHRRAGRAG